MSSERKLLLVSFHRNHALHQKIAILDAWRTEHELDKIDAQAILAAPEKLEEYLEYRFLYEEFSHEGMDASAKGRLEALDKAFPGWLQWPVVFEAPGLPVADSALERAFRQRIAVAADPSQTEVRRARLMPLRDKDQNNIEPVIFVISGISDPLRPDDAPPPGGGLRVDRDLVTKILPDTLILLDLGLQSMTPEMVERIPLPPPYKKVLHLRAGAWDKGDGRRSVTVPDVDRRDPGSYVLKIGQWLEQHPETKGREWGNEPLALAWFGANWNQAMAAAIYLNGCSGGFPAFVFFVYKGGEDASMQDINCYDPVLVGARSIRQHCHPAEADEKGYTIDGPKHPPTSAEPTPTAASVAWLMHRWPRWLGHQNGSNETRPCAGCLELPLDADELKLRDVLEPVVYRQFSNLCSHVDASDPKTMEGRAARSAAHSYARTVATEYRNNPLWCQQVQATLASLSDGKPEVQCNCSNRECCPEIVLQRDSLQKVVTLRGLLGDVLRDASEYGRGRCCVTCRCDEDRLYLGLAHDGQPLSEDDLHNICNHPKDGVKARLSFAKNHLAHLRLFWVDDAGQCWSVYRDGGEWEMGERGIVYTRPPATDWAPKTAVRTSPLPVGLKTMWQFELPLDILKVP